MNEFPRLKININGFIKKNSFFNDEERKNTLLSINKNSSFLKKIIEFKKKKEVLVISQLSIIIKLKNIMKQLLINQFQKYIKTQNI